MDERSDPVPEEPTAARPRRRRRRRLLIACGLLLVGCALLPQCLVHTLGGAFSYAPEEMADGLSDEAKALVAAAFEGLDRERLVDVHTHIVGLGQGGTGITVHPEMQTWAHPVKHMRFLVYMSAAGVEDAEVVDAAYAERLLSLIRTVPGHGRHGALAFDRAYHPDGTDFPEATEFHVPNAYVFDLAERHPDALFPVMSVHPYRKDAIEALERWAARGGRLCKWLPNAMRIDPADPAIEPFYRRMAELGVALLSHSGDEQAVDAGDAQRYGNPLRLRAALDAGVTVIVAHCATLGEGEDLDHPGADPVPNFELFLRLMGEERYEGRLFGEISATTQYNRVDHGLETLLDREDLHARLVNGSDYPLPAVNVVIWTRLLLRRGYITSKERELLNEIYDYNPMLFDLVVKRTIRSPGTGRRFSPEAFLAPAALGLRGVPAVEPR